MEIIKGNHSHYINIQRAFCRSELFFSCDGALKTHHQRSDQRAVYGQK